MYKIRKVTFHDHPILGNVTLDFCDKYDRAVDTVILAGENGTGKSTVLNELYKVTTNDVDYPIDLELEDNSRTNPLALTYSLKDINGRQLMYVNGVFVKSSGQKYSDGLTGIFSDVDINFSTNEEVSAVTSMNLDSNGKSRRSTSNLATQIKQLLVDIKSLDDSDTSRAVSESSPDTPVREIQARATRMDRFTASFNKMFDDISFDGIVNKNGHKSILFKRNNNSIVIDNLSSGEKQIIYRGCFLLRDVDAMNGAFIFIDEPEISLHPTWQTKIMDYYKGMFTNDKCEQASQIFIATHSPFIIHNDNRKNDKVIVLKRDGGGTINVESSPEYYKCSSTKAIQDAFSTHAFIGSSPTVYLEGETDERYFNKTVEVYERSDLPFQFKWIGYTNESGNSVNTGCSALRKAFQFLVSQNSTVKNVCLYDCDTNHAEHSQNNTYARTISQYASKIEKGIENALILDDIDLSGYYSIEENSDGRSGKHATDKLDKVNLCNHICSLNDVERAKHILKNLNDEIDELLTIFLPDS